MSGGVPLKRLQFSLTTAMIAITAVAVFCAIDRLERGFSYSLLLPAALLTVACEIARSRDRPEWVWSLIAIGWMIASIHFVRETTSGLFGLITPRTAKISEVLYGLSFTYVSNAVLPLLLTAPAIWLMSKSAPKRPSPSLKWVKWCVTVVVIDLHLLALSLAIIFATRTSW